MSAPRPLFKTAAEACRDRTEPDVLLAPYLMAGTIVNLVGKIKTGKTSVLLDMVRCGRTGARFCGFSPPRAPFRTLIATEQHEPSFHKQLRDAGLHEDDGVLFTCYPWWRGRAWADVARQLIRYAVNQSCALLVLDTATRWFGFAGDQENDAGAAVYIDRLNPYVEQGGTVILSRHGRKGGGAVADAGRGSSALEGCADTILHLTKGTGGAPADTRELEALGRFEMPERAAPT